MPKYCIINPKGKEVSVHLTIDNAGQSGGDFWLWEFNGTDYKPIEKHNVSTIPQTGLLKFTIKKNASELHGKILTWKIQSCARNSASKDLKIRIQFLQGTEKCKTTTSIRYRKEYPSCRSGQSLQNNGEITFAGIESQETSRLWVDM